jgi:hypothetical protein
MVIIVNIKQCGKPAPPEPDPIEQIDSIELRIDTIQITKIKTITKLKQKSNMKQVLFLALLTVGKLASAQTSEIPLTSICIQDSIHTPVELYKADNIRLNTLYRELQLCDSLRILELYELNDQKAISTQYKKSLELKHKCLKILPQIHVTR